MISSFQRFLFLGILFSFLVAPVIASAQYNPLGTACNSSDEAKNSPACVENKQGQTDARKEQDPITGRKGLISDVADIIAFAGGVISIIIIIVAGLSMVTANGDSGKVKSARDSIIYASIGLVVIALARGIVIFVINSTN
jgi:hypothetical protein